MKTNESPKPEAWRIAFGSPRASQLFDAAPELLDAAPELLDAAKAFLAKLSQMTTEDFANGGDKAVREALALAIAKAEGRTA